jgi:hypothetical protein
MKELLGCMSTNSPAHIRLKPWWALSCQSRKAEFCVVGVCVKKCAASREKVCKCHNIERAIRNWELWRNSECVWEQRRKEIFFLAVRHTQKYLGFPLENCWVLILREIIIVFGENLKLGIKLKKNYCNWVL